jgi:hypothetical protein
VADELQTVLPEKFECGGDNKMEFGGINKENYRTSAVDRK